jgi:hypothetical protein
MVLPRGRKRFTVEIIGYDGRRRRVGRAVATGKYQRMPENGSSSDRKCIAPVRHLIQNYSVGSQRDQKKSLAFLINCPTVSQPLQCQNCGVEARPHATCFCPSASTPLRNSHGLCKEFPPPRRSALFPPILPDKITIFSKPLLRDFSDSEDLREQIRTTVLHEIAHYFGFDDDEIDKLGY